MGRYVVTSEAEVQMNVLSFGCCKNCECHVPSPNVFRGIALARGSAGYEYDLIGLGALIL